MPHNIIIYDSGIGGLSIAREIRRTVPDARLSYACDNAFFPYGDKEQTWLKERITTYVQNIVHTTSVDALVVACNTASTLALAHLREIYDFPIIGVVPAIKPAAEQSATQDIIVLATPNTSETPYLHDLITRYAPRAHVHLIAHPELADVAERFFWDDTIDDAIITDVCARIRTYAHADTIVLACTHYIFLQKTLQQKLRKTYNWIDSCSAVARQTARALQGVEGTANEQHNTCFVSKPLKNPAHLARMKEYGFTHVHTIE